MFISLHCCILCVCVLGKILGITRGFTTQQLMLLKQTPLHQQALVTAPSTQIVPSISAQTPPAIVQQKLSLPTGIEQLRATVASAASRFTGIATNSGGTVKGLSGGRAFHAEEVLKQQSVRMAPKTSPTQAGIASTVVQVPSTKVVSTPGVIGSGDKGHMKTLTQQTKHDKD